MRPVVFIIRDGWGVNPRQDGNSVYGAKTPVIDQILPRLLELDAHVLIFADHGNAEQMVDYKSGLTKTSHTLNLVDCFYVANDAAGVRLTPLAKLSAVAPTALQMLGIPVPSEMTTPSLLAGKEPWSKTALNV